MIVKASEFGSVKMTRFLAALICFAAFGSAALAQHPGEPDPNPTVPSPLIPDSPVYPMPQPDGGVILVPGEPPIGNPTTPRGPIEPTLACPTLVQAIASLMVAQHPGEPDPNPVPTPTPTPTPVYPYVPGNDNPVIPPGGNPGDPPVGGPWLPKGPSEPDFQGMPIPGTPWCDVRKIAYECVLRPENYDEVVVGNILL